MVEGTLQLLWHEGFDESYLVDDEVRWGRVVGLQGINHRCSTLSGL